MKNKKLMIIIVAILLLAGGICALIFFPKNGAGSAAGSEEPTALSAAGSSVAEKGARLTVWYSDSSLTDYMNAVCGEYMERTGVRVTPEYISGIDFLDEAKNAAQENGVPDVFVVPNTSLEEASLLLAKEVDGSSAFINADRYPDVAIHSITYKGNKVAYPLSYENTFMVYNRTYLETYARDKIESERAQEAADNAEAGQEPGETENATDEEVAELTQSFVPESFEALQEFADEYNAPSGVEAVLGWDTSDVLYTYFVLGSSIDLGGQDGDDDNSFKVINGNSVDCMEEYRALTQYFSLDGEDASYNHIRDAFCEGGFVFAIVTTDIVKELEEKINDGTFAWDYEVCPLPDIVNSIDAAAMSITDCACVSKYTAYPKAAEDFAQFLAGRDSAQILYDKAGRLSPSKEAADIYLHGADVLEEYARSVPAPKLMRRADFWMRMEIAYMKTAGGADPRIALQELEKSLK